MYVSLNFKFFYNIEYNKIERNHTKGNCELNLIEQKDNGLEELWKDKVYYTFFSNKNDIINEKKNI